MNGSRVHGPRSMAGKQPPLAGVRVLDYSQFVAGPFATTLLADLGADVIKVEAPTGDAYRHHDPVGASESRYFYALNRGKRSVVCDLKTGRGRAVSRALVATADAIVHNMPPARATRFGLDAASIHSVNPRTVLVAVSAFGSDGPQSDHRAYDLIAQAYSGLLTADARVGDTVPRRGGGIPYSDITAGLLACVSVLAGLLGRDSATAPSLEVSLLGAALATQIQTFIRTEVDRGRQGSGSGDPVTVDQLRKIAHQIEEHNQFEPYYRCYQASDGFFALSCLNVAQRRRLLALLDLHDPWVENPQAAPRTEEERAQRADLHRQFAETFARRTISYWVTRLAEVDVPAGSVRLLEQSFCDEQVQANGLVQRLHQHCGGAVELLGNLFKVDGTAPPSPLPAPGLGEHTDEVITELGMQPSRFTAGEADLDAQ